MKEDWRRKKEKNKREKVRVTEGGKSMCNNLIWQFDKGVRKYPEN